MNHHVMVVGGFRDKVDAATAPWSRPTPARSSSPAPARARPSLRDASGQGGIEASTCTATCRSGCVSATSTSSPPARPRSSCHRRRRPRHPRRQRRARRALRRPHRPQGLPAPLRSHRPRRQVGHGRHHHHAAPGRRDRPAAVARRGRLRHHDIRTTPRPITAEVLAESGQATGRSQGGGRGPVRRVPGGRPEPGGYRGGGARRPRDVPTATAVPVARVARAPDPPRQDRPARTRDDRPARTGDSGDSRSFERARPCARAAPDGPPHPPRGPPAEGRPTVMVGRPSRVRVRAGVSDRRCGAPRRAWSRHAACS